MAETYKFYKGYIPTRNKESQVKFKDKTSEELLTLGEAERLEEYAGVLNDNTVLVDVDTDEEYQILLKIVESKKLGCRVYKSRSGGHFLFLNNGRLVKNKGHDGKWMTAIGLKMVDFKLGSRTQYEVLKIEGKTRELIYDAGKYETIPIWLTPISRVVNFLDMKNGDGRNQTLFNYILTLDSAGLDMSDVRETIGVINRYVLKDPLPEDELNTILRDESFPKPSDRRPSFFNDREFLFDQFAHFLIQQHHIIRITNELHIYEDGIYKSGAENIENAMIGYIPRLTKTQRAEVLAYINVLIRKNSQQADARYIAFQNGIYNIDTKEFLGFSPDIVIINKIPHNYNPQAYSQLVDKTLDKLAVGDRDIRSLLEESIGYTFYRRNELRKFFMLTGDKRNGKSTYIEMLNNLLGEENTVALDMEEIKSGGFKTAELVNMLACLGDDIDGDYISKPGMLKKLISGSRANVEQKYKNPKDFKNYSKMFFSANKPPKVRDETGAFLDRMIVVPFNATFSESDPDYDPYITYKLKAESCMEYLIQIGIEGLIRVLKNYKFTSSKKLEVELEEYRTMNDPILMFFEELDYEVDILNQPSNDVYSRYTTFCARNNFKPLGHIEFSKRVKDEFGAVTKVKSVNGKKIRVFVN